MPEGDLMFLALSGLAMVAFALTLFVQSQRDRGSR